LDEKRKRAVLIGLTGGIASGKSTVSQKLERLGAHIIDADELSRDVLKGESPAAYDLRVSFGDHVFQQNGNIDRVALAKVVFTNPVARRRLEWIVHPQVQARAATVLAAQDKLSSKEKKRRIVVFDAALLVETGAYRQMDRVVVVSAPTEARISRLATRDHLSEKDARDRMASQINEDQRISIADYVIENSGDLDCLDKQVVSLWKRITGKER
jgi:dephospho-CoA kinase